MSTDLDAYQATWARYDAKLDESLRLNRALLNESTLSRTRSALRPLIAGLILELGIDLAGVAALGAFAYANLSAIRFLVPAIALDILAIAALAGVVAQIVLAASIDYGLPVGSIQRDLEALRVLRLRSVRWILLLSPLAWTPLSIVALRGFLGVDVYATFGAAYVWINVAFGLAALGLGLWFAKSAAPKLSASGPLAYVARTLEGGELRRAIALAASLREFGERD